MSPENAKNILCLVTSILVLALLILHIARYRKKPKWLRMFYVWIGVLAVLGGAWAFLFPLAINADFSKTGDGAALRQTLIYTTGGLLGVITLGETRHKNDQEHMRQVHSERRSRYATAIEQLADEKAPIRLGGVYTLVKLVDDWLADKKTLPNEKERREEGQVIVNSLCAYIRSPFLLAERAGQLDKPYTKDLQKDFGGDKEKFDADKRAFARDKAALEEERQVRQSIIEEIHKRLQFIVTPDSWSKLDYDFSNAHFFYPIDFAHSYFGAFSNFSGVTFTEEANFSHAISINPVDFSHAIFINRVDFSHAKFAESANFFYTTLGNADFSRGKFIGDTNFSNATFREGAYFSKVIFVGEAKFYRATFTWNAKFIGAIFFNYISFSYAIFKDSKPLFADNKLIAKFSDKVDPLDYNFEAAPESPHKIKLDRQKQYIIPKGADLFNPDDPSMQGYLADEYNYYHLNTTTTSNNVPEGL